MIDNVEKYHSQLYIILGISCFFIFLFQKIPFFSLKIGPATPVLLLPLVILIGCFLKEWVGFWFGFLCGTALDVFMADSRCFNTVAFILVGAGAGFLFHFFFNRNIKAVVLGGLLLCLAYFFSKWLVLTVFLGDSSAVKILFKYELTSALYSALFLVPFFYYVRKLCTRYLIHNN